MAFVGGAAELVGSPLAAVIGGTLVMVTIALVTLAAPSLWRYVPEPIPETRQQPVVDS